MYKKYKFNHNSDQKVWWVSDTHFRHDREFILSKRGFDTITDHDEYLIEDWNEKASTNDTIIHVGDFLLGAGQKSREVAESIIDRLNGNVVFLWGNHNAGVKSIYQDMIPNVIQKGCDDIDEVYPLKMPTTKGSFTFFGHYLLADIKVNNKHSQLVFHAHFASPFCGLIHIRVRYGMYQVTHMVLILNHNLTTHSTNVSMQVLKTLVGLISFEELKKIMDKKQVVHIDHHDKSTNPS